MTKVPDDRRGVTDTSKAASEECACGTPLVTCSCGDSRCPSCDPDDCDVFARVEQPSLAALCVLTGCKP